LLSFDSHARLMDRIELSASAPVVQIPIGIWHGFVVLEHNNAVLEIKPGPQRICRLAPEEGERGSFCRVGHGHRGWKPLGPLRPSSTPPHRAFQYARSTARRGGGRCPPPRISAIDRVSIWNRCPLDIVVKAGALALCVSHYPIWSSIHQSVGRTVVEPIGIVLGELPSWRSEQKSQTSAPGSELIVTTRPKHAENSNARSGAMP
jgi:hypothetical protein